MTETGFLSVKITVIGQGQQRNPVSYSWLNICAIAATGYFIGALPQKTAPYL
jgi:hypothetical protein